jgi:hypothetical protein
MRFALAVVLCACSPGSEATVVEIPPVSLPTPPPASAAPAPPPRAPLGACEAPPDLGGCAEVARVRVGSISLSSSSCWVDLHVAVGDVGRVMRCRSGAVVVFDEVRFGGSFDGRALDACVRTRFPFSDGCTWESTQRVRGTGRSFELTYEEAPVEGHGCAPSSCRASAPLDVVAP